MSKKNDPQASICKSDAYRGESKMCDMSNAFSKCLVIFIDILGSQNRMDFQEMYQINKIFHEELEKNQQFDKPNTAYQRKICSFSDCAYIFYKFKNDVSDDRKDIGKLFTVALCNCEPLFLRFIKKRIIFRGGIYYGDAYIDPQRSMFFGDAVNKAYKLESTTAIHPRIVIDPVVAETVMENVRQVELEIAMKTPEFFPFIGAGLVPNLSETGDGVVEKDIDGQYIFNYLHFPENNILPHDYGLSCQEFLEDLIQYCLEQIDKNTQYKIIDKYYYLLRFAQSKLDNLLESASE